MKYGVYSNAPAKGVAAASSQRRRHSQKWAAYWLSATYSSQNGAMSQVLMTSNPPSPIAASPCVKGERKVAPRLRTCAPATESTSNSNGIATKCGCRSLKNAVKNGNSLIPSGWVLVTTRDEANHQESPSGGQAPATMPSPKFLIPSVAPASLAIQPCESANSNSARRLPQYRPSSVAIADPNADHKAFTCAARARFHTSATNPSVASAGTVAAARLYATPGSTPLSLPRHAAMK